MARFFLCCLAAAACCCCRLALLVPPVQGRPGIGLAGGLGATNRRTAEQQRGTAAKSASSSAWSTSWTAAAAAPGRLRPELRSVPGGPDPLHHHGSPWRPELEPTTP